jgi:hypothetical protein
MADDERIERLVTKRPLHEFSEPRSRLESTTSINFDINDACIHESVPDSRGGNKRRRTVLACTACRTRKTRCDGGRPICSTCETLGYQCVYAQPVYSDNVTVGREHLFTLESRLSVLECKFKSLEQHANRPAPGASCEGELIVGVDGQPVVAADLPDEDIPHAGIPHLKNLALMDYRGKGGGHICFSPILPPSGRELYDWYLTSKQRTIDARFDFFADFHIFPRYVIAIEFVVFAEDEARRCDDLYQVLAKDAINQGYSEYRTHVAYMDLIADHFDHNDSSLRKYVELLKDITDPKGILSPGKQGIWGSSKIAATAKSRIAVAHKEGENCNSSRNGHL